MRTYSLDDAANLAARIVIIHEHFGWRIAWAGIERITSNAYRPVVSPEATDRIPHCLTILSAVVREMDVTVDMEEAIERADALCGFLRAEGMDMPAVAARTLIGALLLPLEDLVSTLAAKLKCMDPVRRERLMDNWIGFPVLDPLLEIVLAANRDREYISRPNPLDVGC